jgi:D-3-phosphoglycerate dehydrogenase / 2-oxoglutarate reductase
MGGCLKVLLLENISAVAAEQFRAAGYEVESLKPALEERELIEKIRGVSILGVRSKTRVSKAVIDAAPGLVVVGAFCIGVDKIDRNAANERGVAVFNDPHSNSRSVAELAMGEIILLLRRTFQASTEMHRGEWNKSAAGAHEVRGLTLGIVGYARSDLNFPTWPKLWACASSSMTAHTCWRAGMRVGRAFASCLRQRMSSRYT